MVEDHLPIHLLEFTHSDRCAIVSERVNSSC
jgi:hypothetical protein